MTNAQNTIQAPYLLFLGDVQDDLSVKTSRGIFEWRPEKCVGELKLPGCGVTLGLPELTCREAAKQGAKTFVLGITNRGGRFPDSWIAIVLRALDAGLDVASGLHRRLADVPVIVERAQKLGRSLFDVRHSLQPGVVGSGIKRRGKRLLTVGTDCSIGKMFTALSIDREMISRGMETNFRATGQTGILIQGSGVSVDAVVADFISGTVETLSPADPADCWHIIEGQGSLFHPSYAGVSLGLLHGAQPDVIVMCHDVTRLHMRGLPHQPLPDLAHCINFNLEAGRLTNPSIKLGGIALNTSSMSAHDADLCSREIAAQFNVPCVDPLRHGVGSIVDGMMASNGG